MQSSYLKRLEAGNQRYLSAERYFGDISPEKRRQTAESGQSPFAAVVACSDSRVIPEAIFDCGIGEIFTIRTAGNTIGEHELGSILYAVRHLHVGLVVVLGHTCCGAVAAAISGCSEDHIRALTDAVKSNIGIECDPKAAAILNAKAGAEYIKAYVDEGVQVKAALYDTKTGEVIFY